MRGKTRRKKKSQKHRKEKKKEKSFERIYCGGKTMIKKGRKLRKFETGIGEANPTKNIE